MLTRFALYNHHINKIFFWLWRYLHKGLGLVFDERGRLIGAVYESFVSQVTKVSHLLDREAVIGHIATANYRIN